MGERFCLGGKKAKRFGRRDPTLSVPSWCPKRKHPCEVRLYGFKSADEQFLHMMVCRDLKKTVSPSGHACALLAVTVTELTPQDFWKRCREETVSDLLHLPVLLYQVLEIDDGIMPCFFYMTEKGIEICPFFDAERARKNIKEEID